MMTQPDCASRSMVPAASLGIAAPHMARFDRLKTREAFKIPEIYEMESGMATAYRSQGSLFLEQEQTHRSRKPLSEIALSA